MKMRLLALFLSLVAVLFAAEPAAPELTAEQTTKLAAAQKLAQSLTYHKGDTVIGDGLAKIAVPEQFRFLNAKDTDTVLTRFWGNPKGGHALGSLVPAGFDPLGGEGWMVIITFDEDGYVKDNDAASIDYTKMLKEMQESTREGSAQREKEGYGSVELVAWAKPPSYDAASHKLYWAKELKFGGQKENTLNYNIRMLGRRGVLVLNAVAGMTQLAEVEAATPAILGMVDFQEGHRYADFNGDTDKTATYGLAALVAGGVAAKAGFFKVLWVGILALKKFIIIGLIALGSQYKKIWNWIRGRKNEEAVATAGTPPSA